MTKGERREGEWEREREREREGEWDDEIYRERTFKSFIFRNYFGFPPSKEVNLSMTE